MKALLKSESGKVTCHVSSLHQEERMPTQPLMQILCPAEAKDVRHPIPIPTPIPEHHRTEEPPHHRHRAEHLPDTGQSPFCPGCDRTAPDRRMGDVGFETCTGSEREARPCGDAHRRGFGNLLENHQDGQTSNNRGQDRQTSNIRGTQVDGGWGGV